MAKKKKKTVDQALAARIKLAVERAFPKHGQKQDAAEKIGTSGSHLSHIMHGNVAPEFDTLRRIAKATHVSVLWLIGEGSGEKKVELRVVGEIAAGEGSYIEYPMPQYEIVDFEPGPEIHGLRVRGRSMEGVAIIEGDIAMIRETEDTSEVKDRDIVAAEIEGVGYTLKAAVVRRGVGNRREVRLYGIGPERTAKYIRIDPSSSGARLKGILEYIKGKRDCRKMGILPPE